MDKSELDKQDMLSELEECCTLTDDAKRVIGYGYDRGYVFASKNNRRNNIICNIIICTGFVAGSLLIKLLF